MTITWVGHGGDTSGTGLSLVPALPGSPQTRDMVFVAADAGEAGITTMVAGWTKRYGNISGGNNASLFYTEYDAASPPDTTITRSAGSGTWRAICFAYRPDAGFRVAVDGFGYTQTLSSATVNFPTVNPKGANGLCLFLAIRLNATHTIGDVSGTDPGPPTERFDGISYHSLADGIRTVATETGARTATNSVVIDNIGAVLLLRQRQGPEVTRGSRIRINPWINY